jgi:hypothetical protein
MPKANVTPARCSALQVKKKQLINSSYDIHQNNFITFLTRTHKRRSVLDVRSWKLSNVLKGQS